MSSASPSSKERSPEPPKKHLPNGNYQRADWFEAECELLRGQLSQFAQRIADCEISLGTFDPGASSEYWLKYAPGPMSAKPSQPVETTEKPRTYIAVIEPHHDRMLIGGRYVMIEKVYEALNIDRPSEKASACPKCEAVRTLGLTSCFEHSPKNGKGDDCGDNCTLCRES